MWNKFATAFRDHHILEAVMDKKANEFRNLKMASMKVQEYAKKFHELMRYAPDDTNTEKKKMYWFRKGLHHGMEMHLAMHDCQNLHALVGKVLRVEKSWLEYEESRDFKRKTTTVPSATEAAQLPAQQQQQYRNPSAGGGGSGQVHTGQYQMTVKTPTPGGQPQRNLARSAPPPTRSCLNHLTAEDAATAPDVAPTEFLVDSVKATVLFDTGAKFSYVSTKFVKERSLPTMPRPKVIITSSPLGEVRRILECKAVPFMIEKQWFLADLMVLESSGIDVILGMDWMAKHKGLVSCNPRFIRLEHPSGVQV
ncbi:uncharacterized protein [Setaria viridis]|uniref:uncharacterized protein n=1 Tax=Setaria viridis TaxID=4556 RepID=UPI003B3A58A6